MARTEKYFLGPTLLGQIRGVVERVGGQPIGVNSARIETRLQDDSGGGGGGGSLRLGVVTAAWNKNSLRDVVVYSQGAALAEAAAAPPQVLTACVNKFVNVQANKMVMVGKVNGRWYLVSAEC
jgi:hypothetical protein